MDSELEQEMRHSRDVLGKLATCAAVLSLAFFRIVASDKPDGEDEDEEYECYLQERGALLKAEHETSDHLDEALLKLSGGALALSLTLFRFITPAPVGLTRWYLLGAWGSFGLAVVAVLIGYHTSKSAFRKRWRSLDQAYKCGDQPPKKVSWDSWTRVLNFLALGAFVVGVILFALFAWGNATTLSPSGGVTR
jgi:hypothetical protein